ncbi:MAG: zinc ABC transporter substrate-binding protein [Ardenticatenaceae bacterium]|nr:zinc ABC transporter substrate-binding protein [Ardenticatenaceae bacterium]
MLIGCTSSAEPEETPNSNTTDEHDVEHEHDDSTETLSLPELGAAALNGRKLTVVATTSIIGDVVAQVGGEAIDLTILMEAGQDPHSYEPGAQELTAVADADVIFINGWDLEESLVDSLESIGEEALVVPISANIHPLAFGEDEHEHEGEEAEHEEEDEHDEGEHHHSGADPHVWFSIHNVEQWMENVEHVLSELDPTHAGTYEANATAYMTELAELEAYAEAQLAPIPTEKRFLVTNHDSFGYFAEEYDFTVLGTVIPSISTAAEPSASDLTDLIAEMEEHTVCTIFTETTVNDTLAQTVASELSGCDAVQVLKLYTGAVGSEGSGAESYIGMFRTNIDTIVDGLKQ